MTRQQMIDDFKHFLDTHQEEVRVHLQEPQKEWFEDDGWDEILTHSNSVITHSDFF